VEYTQNRSLWKASCEKKNEAETAHRWRKERPQFPGRVVYGGVVRWKSNEYGKNDVVQIRKKSTNKGAGG